MSSRLTRRRLVTASLLGVPLLAACSEGGSHSTPLSVADQGATDTTGAVPDGALDVADDASAAAEQSAPPPPDGVAETGPRPKTIILDPGHGGEEIGAASAIAGLPNLLEKDSNLAFSSRLRELLEGDGYRVLMTRDSDGRAFGYTRPDPATIAAADASAPITVARSDLQARVEYANAGRGDLFLSLHSNDSGSLDENGVEVWYCADREDGAANGVRAQIVLENVLDALRGYGYRANNRGTKEDRYFRVRNGRNFHLFVLGPANPDARHPRATMMPAALVENLFMRHARDQFVLRDPAAREAIAQGMRRSVQRFFEWQSG
jgi:N-acetylmuramoyl-L-alanine amidase